MNTRAFKRGSEPAARASMRAARGRPVPRRENPPPRPLRAQAAERVLVWDFPTRLFHWSLVLAVSVAVITGEIGGDWMGVHGKAGLTIVGLVVFRLVWGVIGSAHARFASFAPTPGRVRSYLTGKWQGHGHNPLGALSVFALLALLGAQAGTGLFANDDIAFTGPLYSLVEDSFALRLTGLHRQLANVLLALIALHVVAIVVYLVVRKTNLVTPMVTGYKRAAAASGGKAKASAGEGGPLSFGVALLLAIAAVVAASGAFNGAPAPAVQASSSSPAAAPVAPVAGTPSW